MPRIDVDLDSDLLRKLDKYKRFLRKVSGEKVTRSVLVRGILTRFLQDNPVVEVEKEK
jgi:hypothetical protein